MDLNDLFVRLYLAFRERNANRGFRYEGVTVDKNIRYGDRKFQTFSLYRKSERVLPVIINFHGGAIAGRKSYERRAFCVALAANLDVAVINVEYRGETSLGAKECLKETEKILLYLAMNYRSLAISINKVLLLGDEMGAYVASCLATKAGEHGIGVLGVIGLCGLYDALELAKENQHYLMKKFFKDALKKAPESSLASALSELSVTRMIDENYPPCFIAHTAHDEFLPEQGPKMVSALKQKGVYCYEFKAVYELCYHNWHIDRKNALRKPVMEYLRTFIEEALQGRINKNEYREV